MMDNILTLGEKYPKGVSVLCLPLTAFSVSQHELFQADLETGKDIQTMIPFGAELWHPFIVRQTPLVVEGHEETEVKMEAKSQKTYKGILQTNWV